MGGELCVGPAVLRECRGGTTTSERQSGDAPSRCNTWVRRMRRVEGGAGGKGQPTWTNDVTWNCMERTGDRHGVGPSSKAGTADW